MPGSTPATSQLDWLSSTTAMIVLSWSKATRDLLKSFSWGITALRQLFASGDGAISSPPAPYHLPVPGREAVKPSCETVSKTGADLLGNRRFESISLHRRVNCEPGFLVQGLSPSSCQQTAPTTPSDSRARRARARRAAPRYGPDYRRGKKPASPPLSY